MLHEGSRVRNEPDMGYMVLNQEFEVSGCVAGGSRWSSGTTGCAACVWCCPGQVRQSRVSQVPIDVLAGVILANSAFGALKPVPHSTGPVC